MRYCSCLLLLVITGCNLEIGGLKVQMKDKANQMVATSVTNSEIQSAVTAMSGLTKDEVTVVYKRYAGLAEFIENTNKFTNTREIDTTIKQYNTIYLKTGNEMWLSYMDMWVKEKGMNKSKDIVSVVSDETKEISRSELVTNFRILAEAAKLKLDQMDVSR